MMQGLSGILCAQLQGLVCEVSTGVICHKAISRWMAWSGQYLMEVDFPDYLPFYTLVGHNHLTAVNKLQQPIQW